MSRKGTEPTAERLAWCDWTILVTSVQTELAIFQLPRRPSPTRSQVVAVRPDPRNVSWRKTLVIAIIAILPPGRVLGHAHQLSFTPDLKRLVATYADGSARIWSCPESRMQLQIDDIAKEAGLTIAPDGQRMAFLDSKGFGQIWSLSENREITRIKTPQARLAFTTDGSQLVLFSGNTIHLCPTDTSQSVRDLRVPDQMGNGLALTPDGERALTCSWGTGALHLTDLKTGKQIRTFFPDARWDGQAVAVSPDGRRAAAWLRSGGLKLLDLTNREDSASTEIEASVGRRDGRPISLTFSPNGQFMATVDGNEQVVGYDALTGKKRFGWQLAGPVNTVTFAADGRHLATANGNGTVYILRVAPPQGK